MSALERLGGETVTGHQQNFARRIVPLATAALFVVAIAMMLIARFQNVNPVVLPFLQQAAHPTLYAQDMYVNAAIVARSSPVFPLLEALRFDLTAPIAVVAAYLTAAGIAGWGVWRILTGPLGVARPLTALMLLFLAVFADFKLVELNKAAWIFEHNFSLTMLAAAGRVWFLYALLAWRPVLMAAVLIPINLFAFKVGWPLVLIAGAVLFWRRDRSAWSWALLALAMIAPVWAAVTQSARLPTEEARAVLEVLKAAYTKEDDPFAISWMSKALFVAGLGFLWFRGPSYGSAVALGLRVGAGVSAAIFMGGGLYFALSDLLPPVPAIVLLSPARALETVGLATYLLALVEVVRAPALKTTEKVPLLLSLTVLKVTPDLTWVVLATLLAVGAGLIWLARRWLEARWPRVGRLADGLSPTGVIGLAAPVMAAVFLFNLAGVRTVQAYDPGLGFRDAAIAPSAADMLQTVRAESEDRRLIFLASGSEGWRAARWNALARKSGLAGDPYYLPRHALMERQARLNALILRLAEEVEAGRVSPGTTAQLSACRARVLAPEEAQAALGGWILVRRYGDWIELAPPPATPIDPVCG
jgi:hypothetical protein